MSKLITLEERRELIKLIDYIEDRRTEELMRKLYGSYNVVYTNLKEKIAEDKRASLLEVQYREEKEKCKKKDKKIDSLKNKLHREIDNNIENYRKLTEAESRVKALEKKLKNLHKKEEDDD